MAWLRLAVGPQEWCAGFFDACPSLSVGRVSSRNRARRAVLSASLAARYGYCLPDDPAARLGVSPDFPPIAERCCIHGLSAAGERKLTLAYCAQCAHPAF